VAGDASGRWAFDPSLADQLACPACLGDLKLEESRLVCQSCGRAYPVVDGIPVLIADGDIKKTTLQNDSMRIPGKEAS
jgi:uncharacterized protein YbaR (Trm112 family)